MGDLGVRWKSLQLSKRERRRASNEAVNCQAPIPKPIREQSLIVLLLRRLAIHRHHAGAVTTGEFASQRLASHQQTLGGIRKCFADTVKSTVVRRDQTVSISQSKNTGQSRNAPSCYCEPRDNKFASANLLAHVSSEARSARPVIIARIRVLKPVSHTITTCTMRKITTAAPAKKWMVLADC